MRGFLALRRTVLLVLTMLSMLGLTACNEEVRNLVNGDRWLSGRSILSRGEAQLDLGIAAQLLTEHYAGRGAYPHNALRNVANNRAYYCDVLIADGGGGTSLRDSHHRVMSHPYTRGLILSRAWRWVGTGYQHTLPPRLLKHHVAYVFAGSSATCRAGALPDDAALAEMAEQGILVVKLSAPDAKDESRNEGGDGSLLSHETMAEAIPQLDPALLRLALHDPALRAQGFHLLLTGRLPQAGDAPVRQVTATQVAEATRLIAQVAEAHPDLKDDLLKAWESYQRSLEIVTP